MHRDNRYGAVLALAAAFFLIFTASRTGAIRGGADTEDRHSIQGDGGRERGAWAGGASAAEFPGLPMDLNSATREELMTLPGVGEKTADRIIEERGRRNGFNSVSDLLGIERLGASRLERLRGLVYVKGAEGLTEPAGLSGPYPSDTD